MNTAHLMLFADDDKDELARQLAEASAPKNRYRSTRKRAKPKPKKRARIK